MPPLLAGDASYGELGEVLLNFVAASEAEEEDGKEVNRSNTAYATSWRVFQAFE